MAYHSAGESKIGRLKRISRVIFVVRRAASMDPFERLIKCIVVGVSDIGSNITDLHPRTSQQLCGFIHAQPFDVTGKIFPCIFLKETGQVFFRQMKPTGNLIETEVGISILFFDKIRNVLQQFPRVVFVLKYHIITDFIESAF